MVMTKQLFKKQASRAQLNWIVALAVLVGACLLFWFWYNQAYLKPVNVFWGTIGNNLNVNFVTRTYVRSADSQKLTQVTDVMYNPALVARSTVTLENASTNEKVVTETIGTTTTDYLRYLEIKSNKTQTTPAAIGVWAKNQPGEGQQPQILPDALLGSVLMFGNLSGSQRNEIMNQLKSTNAFQKYDLIAKKTVDGRKLYSYAVTLNLEKYSPIYANYLKMIGQEKLAQQLGQQQPGATYEFVLDINAGSRVPTAIHVGGDKGDTETFTHVGSAPKIVAPDAKLTITELQDKLSGK